MNARASENNSNKGTTARLNETRFGPKKKLYPIYLGPKNLDTFDALRAIAKQFSDARAFMAVPVSYTFF
jgi:hypothetical protein